jgi:carbohydrate-binding DOMON domain-containing protein
LLLFIVVVAVAFVKTKESEAKIQERNLTLSERRAEIYKVSKQDEGDTSLDYYLACKNTHTHNTHTYTQLTNCTDYEPKTTTRELNHCYMQLYFWRRRNALTAGIRLHSNHWT